MLWGLTHVPDLGMNYRWSNLLRKQEWRAKWYNPKLYGQRFTSFLACGTRRALWIMSVFLRLDVGQTQLLHPVKCCWLTIRTCCIVQTMTSLQPEGLASLPYRNCIVARRLLYYALIWNWSFLSGCKLSYVVFCRSRTPVWDCFPLFWLRFS